MKFLLDHDVPDDLSHLLNQMGHAVVFLRDVRLAEKTALLRLLEGAGESGLAGNINFVRPQ